MTITKSRRPGTHCSCVHQCETLNAPDQGPGSAAVRGYAFVTDWITGEFWHCKPREIISELSTQLLGAQRLGVPFGSCRPPSPSSLSPVSPPSRHRPTGLSHNIPMPVIVHCRSPLHSDRACTCPGVVLGAFFLSPTVHHIPDTLLFDKNSRASHFRQPHRSGTQHAKSTPIASKTPVRLFF